MFVFFSIQAMKGQNFNSCNFWYCKLFGFAYNLSWQFSLWLWALPIVSTGKTLVQICTGKLSYKGNRYILLSWYCLYLLTNFCHSYRQCKYSWFYLLLLHESLPVQICTSVFPVLTIGTKYNSVSIQNYNINNLSIYRTQHVF